jgi:hypothetical protein
MDISTSQLISWAEFLKLRNSQSWMGSVRDMVPAPDLVPVVHQVVDQVEVMGEMEEVALDVEVVLVENLMTTMLFHQWQEVELESALMEKPTLEDVVVRQFDWHIALL